MVDDMGFSDISSYGSEIQTPNIDKLAENGLKFTQFYNAGRCCPSRASLLTGLYAHKTGLGYMTAQDYNKPGYRADLNDECITIAEALKGSGYSTYMSGKWHVNLNIKPEESKHNWPLQRGFDKFFGTLMGAGSYWNPLTLVEGNAFIKPDKNFYYTEAITDKSIQYVSNHDHTKPFFLYMAYTAPHWPLHAREEAIAKHRGKFKEGWDVLREKRIDRLKHLGIINNKWELAPLDKDNIPWTKVKNKEWEQTRMEAFAGTLEHVDQGIGKLVTHLKNSNNLENTIIFFLSDNGGDKTEHINGMIGNSGKPWSVMAYVPLFTKSGEIVIAGDYPGVKLGPENTYGGYGLKWANLSNTPFKKFKTYMHEGGIASPLIVHWPKGIPSKNELRRQPAHIIDIMATSLELANIKYPKSYKNKNIKPIDGKSLLPILHSDTKVRDTIFWEHQGNRAVRIGNWKLVSSLENKEWELYDMENDRTENFDLSIKYPDKVLEMENIYNVWASKSNVLPWEDMKINVIAGKKSPYSRPREEADKAYNEVQVHLKKLKTLKEFETK
jgi:arylsulfatase